MKRIGRLVATAAACLAVGDVAGPGAAAEASEQAIAGVPKSCAMVLRKDAQSVIALWPDKTRIAAQALIEKYGAPDDLWNNWMEWSPRGPILAVEIFRDAVPVDDPIPHEDFIVSKVGYKVPANRVGALARFSPEIVVDQIRGWVAVHGESEQYNTLALNLAQEIIADKRDVASARSFMNKTLKEATAGKSSPYTDGLMFAPPLGPDVPSGR
jgi:hypothetical protein